MKKTVLSLLLASILLVTCFIPATANTTMAETPADANTEIAADTSTPVATAGSITEQPLPLAEENDAIGLLMDSIDGNAYVASYFDDNQVYHIIPTPDSKDVVKNVVTSFTRTRHAGLPQIVIDSPASNMRSANTTYSHNDLLEGRAFLLNNGDELQIQAVAFSLDNIGKIDVFLSDGASNAIKDNILQASPVKAIVFRDISDIQHYDHQNDESDIRAGGAAPRITSTDLRGGNWLRRSKSSNWSTIAISAYYNGKAGLLTCAHGYTNGQTVYASDNSVLGTMTKWHTNTMDAGFVTLNNPSNSSNRVLADGKQVTAYSSSRISDKYLGQAIRQYGARSNSKGRNGKIHMTGVSWSGTNFQGEYFLTNLTVIEGDSGGPVIRTSSNKNTLLGIDVGGTGSTGVTDQYKYTVFQNISDVLAETDITLY